MLLVTLGLYDMKHRTVPRWLCLSLCLFVCLSVTWLILTIMDEFSQILLGVTSIGTKSPLG